MVRIAIIDNLKCKPTKCNFECGLSCPSNRQGKLCIQVVDIEDMGVVSKKAKISSNLCIGCNICVKKCPFDAVSIINLPEELETDKLLYTYGENSFRIYKYPSIKKGHCVGLLGSNGLGKSTILKIMANEIKVDNKMFVGDELYKYMSLLQNNKLSISYKPQEITKFRKLTAKVSDYVSKTNLVSSKYISEFQLEHLLNRQINQLSGGELQRLLIALTCVQNVDSYIFDEPSAFLDIKQRIIASNMIKEKCTENTYLVCVEHDLCILDYICDYVSCLYGVTNCYGVVTSIQGTRNGINSYLDGYFKSENLRFREMPVHFNKYLIEKTDKKETCVYEYDSFDIKHNSFNLRANTGKINMNEITLLIGENGTGKTSFIQKIAENKDIVASIKSQNPYLKYDGRVIDYLEDNINKSLSNQKFVFGVIKALGVDKLYDMNVNNLSGGQMQKLSIVVCLGKDANLYLLDEPSAFIDIEDRCKLAKIIKQFVYDKKTSIYIIEHDITLATNIADKVIVFEGTPGIDCMASEPYELATGVNLFLKNIDVTMRKDKVSGRPGINKFKSQKDIEQKQSGNHFIIE
jgi:ATP-binding cassette subfamily E protein 1